MIDFGGMLNLKKEEEKVKEREKSIILCVLGHARRILNCFVAGAGRICYVRNFKISALSQINRTLSVRFYYRFY